MGRDLSVNSDIFTIEQVKKLEVGELYFLNSYESELITREKAESITNDICIAELGYEIEEDVEKVTKALTDYCKDNKDFNLQNFLEDYLDVDLEDIPLTLTEFINQDCEDPREISLEKKEIDGKEFYLFTDARYW